jgi:hypothetical protein
MMLCLNQVLGGWWDVLACQASKISLILVGVRVDVCACVWCQLGNKMEDKAGWRLSL